MITFFKKIDDNQKIIQLLSYNDILPTFIDKNIIQITEDEYNQHTLEFEEKALLTDKLYKKEIDISDVSLEWQEEIQANVDKIILEIGAFEEQNISNEEFVNMIEEAL